MKREDIIQEDNNTRSNNTRRRWHKDDKFKGDIVNNSKVEPSENSMEETCIDEELSREILILHEGLPLARQEKEFFKFRPIRVYV